MKRTNQIEGDWGDFLIRIIGHSDIPAILEHLKENFHKDEPVISLCPPADDNYTDFMNGRVADLLGKYLHLSFIAIHKSTNEIAGCQLQFKWTKEEAESGNTPHYGNPNQEIPQTRKIFNKVMAPFDKPKIDMFYRFGVDAVGWNFMASTAKKFRGQGLASEMYRRMVILLREENFKLAFSVFTSPFSRRCAEKLGFRETARIELESVKDENGKKLLPNSGKDDFVSLMVLEL